MVFRNLFRRGSPEVTNTSEYCIRRAYNTDCVDGVFDKYDLKQMTRGGKVVDRVFIPKVKGKHPSRNLFCFDTQQYGIIQKQIDEGKLTEKQYRHLQKHHVDSEEEKSVLVKLVQTDKGYSMDLVGELAGSPKKHD